MSEGWMLFITVVCLPHSSYAACCKSSFAYLEDALSLLFLLSFFTELVLQYIISLEMLKGSGSLNQASI